MAGKFARQPRLHIKIAKQALLPPLAERAPANRETGRGRKFGMKQPFRRRVCFPLVNLRKIIVADCWHTGCLISIFPR